MEERLNALEEDMSLTAAEMFADELAEIDGRTEHDDDLQQRILSSVMRKAGFEMNNTVVVKMSKKKKLIAMVAAAAALVGSSITAYAVYRYNYGNAFKYRETETGAAISGDVQELESTTQPFDGTILENTFTDVDITIDGVVCETGVDHLLLTASRKDGKPFAESDETVFRSGFGMCIPIQYNEYFRDKDITDTSELYWDSEPVHIELNDNGTLSIMLDNTWKADDGEYDVIFGFKDIYSYRFSEKTEEEKEEYLEAECELLNGFNDLGLNYHRDGKAAEQSDIEEYNKQTEAVTKLYSTYSDERYEGGFIIKCHVAPNELIITPEENVHGMEIQLSGINCTIRGDGSSFRELAGLAPDIGKGTAELTFLLEDGGEFTEEAEYHIYDNSEYLEDNPDIYPSEAVMGITLSRFTDPYKVTEIRINGKTLWKRQA